MSAMRRIAEASSGRSARAGSPVRRSATNTIVTTSQSVAALRSARVAMNRAT